jgi:hypothetical protein
VPGTDSSSMTRYARDDAGKLVQTGRISFAGLGVVGVFRGPTVGANLVGPDKAYLFDDVNRRVTSRGDAGRPVPCPVRPSG